MRTIAIVTLATLLAAPPGLAADPTPQPSRIVALTGFSWDRVPLNIHFGKRNGDLTDAEIDFLATHSRLIALEKSHGAGTHGSTEAGVADTARRIKQHNPAAKVLFYLNAFINWPGYESFKTDKPADIKADLDTIALAAAKGKFVVIKGWPGFNWLDAYPEFERPLGPPLGEAKQSGWTYRRDFAHASVFVNLETKTARIDWKP